jgi:hypothetical protein
VKAGILDTSPQQNYNGIKLEINVNKKQKLRKLGMEE